MGALPSNPVSDDMSDTQAVRSAPMSTPPLTLRLWDTVSISSRHLAPGLRPNGEGPRQPSPEEGSIDSQTITLCPLTAIDRNNDGSCEVSQSESDSEGPQTPHCRCSPAPWEDQSIDGQLTSSLRMDPSSFSPAASVSTAATVDSPYSGRFSMDGRVGSFRRLGPLPTADYYDGTEVVSRAIVGDVSTTPRSPPTVNPSSSLSERLSCHTNGPSIVELDGTDTDTEAVSLSGPLRSMALSQLPTSDTIPAGLIPSMESLSTSTVGPVGSENEQGIDDDSRLSTVSLRSTYSPTSFNQADNSNGMMTTPESPHTYSRGGSGGCCGRLPGTQVERCVEKGPTASCGVATKEGRPRRRRKSRRGSATKIVSKFNADEVPALTKCAESWPLEDFSCPVCLELLYKPVVLECGHTFCVWCVFKAMNHFEMSQCPMCKSSYNHLPSISRPLHLFLKENFSDQYKLRAFQGFPMYYQTASWAQIEAKQSGISTDLLPSGCRYLEVLRQIDPLGLRYVYSAVNTPKELSESQRRSSVESFKALQRSPSSDNYFQSSLYPDQQTSDSPPPLSSPQSDLLGLTSTTTTTVDHSALMATSSADAEPLNLTSGLLEMEGRESEDQINDFVHFGVMCDSCGIMPLTGSRYQCIECHTPDGQAYDICNACYQNGKHQQSIGRFNQNHKANHKMRLLERSDYEKWCIMLNDLKRVHRELSVRQILDWIISHYSADGSTNLDTFLPGDEDGSLEGDEQITDESGDPHDIHTRQQTPPTSLLNDLDHHRDVDSSSGIIILPNNEGGEPMSAPTATMVDSDHSICNSGNGHRQSLHQISTEEECLTLTSDTADNNDNDSGYSGGVSDRVSDLLMRDGLFVTASEGDGNQVVDNNEEDNEDGRRDGMVIEEQNSVMTMGDRQPDWSLQNIDGDWSGEDGAVDGRGQHRGGDVACPNVGCCIEDNLDNAPTIQTAEESPSMEGLNEDDGVSAGGSRRWERNGVCGLTRLSATAVETSAQAAARRVWCMHPTTGNG